MSEPSEVYLVTAGEYSAYQVLAAYLDRAVADEHVKRYNGPGQGSRYSAAQVEVFKLGEPVPEYQQEWYFWGHLLGRTIPEPYVAHNRGEFARRPSVVAVDVVVIEPGVRVALGVKGRSRTRVAKVWTEQAARIIAEWDIIQTARDLEAS